MERQLLDLYNVAWRSARSGACEPKCLKALSRLRVFPVTTGLLSSARSSVDVFDGVRKLTKHPAKNIRDHSTLVVAAWSKRLLKDIGEDEKYAVNKPNLNGKPLKIIIKFRGQVIDSKLHDVGDGNTIQERTSFKVKDDASLVKEPPSKRASKPKSSESSKNVLKEEIQKPKILIPKEKIHETVDDQKPHCNSTCVPKSTNSLRNNVREQICQALSMVLKEANHDIRSQLNNHDPDHVAASLESALFKKWGASNSGCRTKYRSVLFNIADPKNPDFRRKILLGEIKPETVAAMSAQDMASDERQRKNQGIQARSLWKCIVGRDQEGTTDQFKCGKCGERKTTYRQLQTRSADEPMTTYVTCTVCDNRWKFC